MCRDRGILGLQTRMSAMEQARWQIGRVRDRVCACPPEPCSVLALFGATLLSLFGS